MDDLSAAISGFLEQPGAMEQLEAVAKQLGLNPQNANAQNGSEPSPDTGFDFSDVEKLAPLMQAFRQSSQSTEETALLDALRPFLGAGEKLDRAKRALGLMRTLRTVAGTII